MTHNGFRVSPSPANNRTGKGDTLSAVECERAESCLKITAEFFSEIERWRREFNFGKNARLIRVIDELGRTRKRVARILGSVAPERISWQRRLWLPHEISGIDMFSAETEAAQEAMKKVGPSLEVQAQLAELIARLEGEIYTTELGNPLIPVGGLVGKFLDTYEWGLLDVIRIRIKPSKVVYNLWHRVVRKGSYGDNATVRRLMDEFKGKPEGTPAAFVFQGVDEDSDFESLRKQALYGLSRISRDLVDFLFKASGGHARARADPRSSVR